MPPKLAAIFNRARQETPLGPPLESPSTPNTRKRHRNYHELHYYGLQGSPQASLSQASRPTKRARPNTSRSSRPAPQITAGSEAEHSITLIPDDDPEPPLSLTPLPKKKDENIKKGAWWWVYFNTKRLDTKFYKGKKGQKGQEV